MPRCERMEKVQKRGATFVTRDCTFEKGSMTGILKTKMGIPAERKEG